MKYVITLAMILLLAACEGPAGPMGPEGPQGEQGEQGAQGNRGFSPSTADIVAAVLDSIYSLPQNERPIDLPTPLPIILEGSGNQVTSTFVLVANVLYVLRAEYGEDSYLIVLLLDARTGDSVGGHLLNESAGTSPSSSPCTVDKTGEYLLQIANARGAWTMTLDRP